MRAAERGLLLLCCHLGDPAAHPLTMAQFRTLSLRGRETGIGDGDPRREVDCRELMRLGCDPQNAERIVGLLNRERRLERYLAAAARQGIYPLTRISPGYPPALAAKRGDSAPPCFFCAGNMELLKRPCVGLAGSRRLTPQGAAFAARVGELAAEEGLVLVTGGADGADSVAADACLRSGGDVVLFVPDELQRRTQQAGAHCLLCSEGGYDLPFSPARALTRNGYIHMMGEKTLIAQVRKGGGGTWNGALENLRHGWSELFVCDDGSAGALALEERGATPVHRLMSLAELTPGQKSLF